MIFFFFLKVQQKNIGVNFKIFYVEAQRNMSNDIYQSLKVNYSPDIITLAKEVFYKLLKKRVHKL